MASTAREENAYTLGVQAGLWGYPLVHRVEAFPQTLVAKGIGHNSFRKFDRLKTADDRFVVTPNNLTVDAYAIVDLADGPVVLYVPKLNTDRWFIVQMGDAFDDVVLNVGGSRPPIAGPYLLTGPDYQGRVPGDMIEVPFRSIPGGLPRTQSIHPAIGVRGHALPASLGAYRVAYRRDHLVGESPYDVAGFDPAEDVSADAVDQRELGELLDPHRRRPLEETLAVSAELAADVVDATHCVWRSAGVDRGRVDDPVGGGKQFGRQVGRTGYPSIGDASDQPQHPRLAGTQPDVHVVRRRGSRLRAGV